MTRKFVKLLRENGYFTLKLKIFACGALFGLIQYYNLYTIHMSDV